MHHGGYGSPSVCTPAPSQVALYPQARTSFNPAPCHSNSTRRTHRERESTTINRFLLHTLHVQTDFLLPILHTFVRLVLLPTAQVQRHRTIKATSTDGIITARGFRALESTVYFQSTIAIILVSATCNVQRATTANQPTNQPTTNNLPHRSAGVEFFSQ